MTHDCLKPNNSSIPGLPKTTRAFRRVFRASAPSERGGRQHRSEHARADRSTAVPKPLLRQYGGPTVQGPGEAACVAQHVG